MAYLKKLAIPALKLSEVDLLSDVEPNGVISITVVTEYGDGQNVLMLALTQHEAKELVSDIQAALEEVYDLVMR